MNSVLKELESGFDEGLKGLLELLSIPSVSGDPALSGEVARCAGKLQSQLLLAGISSWVDKTPGHPVVRGEWLNAPGKPTVLIYGHYDVQPATREDGWASDPFTPVIRDGAIFCRGATDDKGQLYCHLMAVKAHLAAKGTLPINVKMLFEGEEESGSKNLEDYLLLKKDELLADAVIISDTAQYAGGIPALTTGLRGLLCLEVIVNGANTDLHSGSFGGAAPNPANGLAKILAGLSAADGRVNVPGFYDRVRTLEEWERREWENLAHDEEALSRSLGVDVLPGEEGYTALERMWARPTFDVNGLWSGYQGDGPKTVIPSVAGAKISFRLVPDQEPEEVGDLIEKRIMALAPPGLKVKVTRHHGARPVLLAREGRLVDAAKLALAESFEMEPVVIREGGSIPVVETFARLLNAPVALMGFGRPDDRAHGPDERFHLLDLKRGARTSARFFQLLADGV